jgi:hypothetical protein
MFFLYLNYLCSCQSSPAEEYTYNYGFKSQDTGQTTNPIESVSDCEAIDGSESSSPLELDGRIDCGEQVYLNRCSNCHGEDGEGTSNGQELNGHIDAHDDATLLFSIQFGEGSMPPQDLSSQDAADVLAYIRFAFGGQ